MTLEALGLILFGCCIVSFLETGKSLCDKFKAEDASKRDKAPQCR